jgi:hypothetical protein
MNTMNTLGDLLLSRNLDQPSELKSINDWLKRNLNCRTTLTDHPKNITIAVPDGKVAYYLRSQLPALESYAAPTKKIYIRIDRSLE